VLSSKDGRQTNPVDLGLQVHHVGVTDAGQALDEEFVADKSVLTQEAKRRVCRHAKTHEPAVGGSNSLDIAWSVAPRAQLAARYRGPGDVFHDDIAAALVSEDDVDLWDAHDAAGFRIHDLGHVLLSQCLAEGEGVVGAVFDPEPRGTRRWEADAVPAEACLGAELDNLLARGDILGEIPGSELERIQRHGSGFRRRGRRTGQGGVRHTWPDEERPYRWRKARVEGSEGVAEAETVGDRMTARLQAPSSA
jgi:hypothetical protein